MTLRDAVSLSACNLMKNPVRTLLTILGLGVGVGAILTVLTLGSAGQAQVESEIARLGVDKVWITADADSGRALCPEDSETVAAATGSSVCAGAYAMGVVTLVDTAVFAQIKGFDQGVETVHQPQLLEGRLFTEREYLSASPVAVVEQSLAEALGGDVLGLRVAVGNRRIRVIGVISDMAVQMASGVAGSVLLPLGTFMDTYAGTSVSELTVSVPRTGRPDKVGASAVEALSAQGGTYTAATLQEEIDAARSVIRIFVMVLTCVAVVCMLVGSIGVMNILLVSVRERRREIGLMKAIGGTARQVGVLFLLEAVCYAVLGGLLGLLTGVTMIRLFGAWIGLNAGLSAETAIPALLCAAALGVLFGVVPALRASSLTPVDALRQE